MTDKPKNDRREYYREWYEQNKDMVRKRSKDYYHRLKELAELGRKVERALDLKAKGPDKRRACLDEPEATQVKDDEPRAR